MILRRGSGRAEHSHGGIKVGDVVTWAGEPHRVTGLYADCDEIVIEPMTAGVDGPFDVLWWEVERRAG